MLSPATWYLHTGLFESRRFFLQHGRHASCTRIVALMAVFLGRFFGVDHGRRALCMDLSRSGRGVGEAPLAKDSLASDLFRLAAWRVRGCSKTF